MTIRISGKLISTQGKLTMTPATLGPPGGDFNALIYTGNDGSNSITGAGFQPDLFWVKNRGSVGSNGRPTAFDSERGENERLRLDLTSAEDTVAFNQTFDADGFSFNTTDTSVNQNGTNYVTWLWETGSQFFDIVTYTGDATAGRTLAHSLGVAPAFMAIKRLNAASEWRVYHQDVGETQYLHFDNDDDAITASDIWNDTAPDSAEFTIGDDITVNANGAPYVAWLWAEQDGASAFGSYAGDGNDGKQITGLGFSPSMVMVKQYAGGANADWYIGDAARGDQNTSLLNSTAGDQTSSSLRINMLSDGFELGTTNINDSGDDFIYCAWA